MIPARTPQTSVPLANSPRISIVTASLNQAKYLGKTIRSVLSQRYSNLEYIVIDGGSTDGTQDIVREHSDHLAFWVSESDSGQSDAIIKGFQRATGELLCWVNSDDALLPGCLRAVARAYADSDKPGVITGNVLYVDEDDRIVRCVRTLRQTVYLGRRGVLCPQAPAIFFQRRLYEQVGGLGPSLHFAMDSDLWFRFLRIGARFVHIPSYLGAFRWHRNSKTGTFRSTCPDAFEHPESKRIREASWPGLTQSRTRLARLELRLLRMLRLDYQRGWIDQRRWRGHRWQDIFGEGS